MDIRFLVTFMEVAKTRHFGKAAENLYLTQSAVSARIKQLEEYFNSALFIRNRNSLQLTPAGEKLLPYAASLAETLELTRQTMNEDNMQYLSIACNVNAWDGYLKPNLQEIKDKLDNISLRTEICSSEQLSRMVHEHSVDLALTTVPFKSDDVESIALSESNLFLYCPKEWADEVEQHFEIALDWGQKANDLIEKRYPQIKKSSLRTSALQVALGYFATNKSAIILPQNIAQSLVEQGSLIEIEALAPLSVTCYLVYLKGSENTGLKQFIAAFA